jgi:hypothetical protein
MAITLDRPADRAHLARGPEPSTPRREVTGAGRHRVRVPELVLGVVLVGASALGALLWQTSNNTRVPVAVLAAPVAAGDAIVESDLRPADVSLAGGVPAVAWEARGQLVGKTAAVALPASTLLLPGLVVDEPALGAGEALVGLKQPAGTYPAGSLFRGDAVAVVQASGPDGQAAEGGVLAASAWVWDVTPLVDEEAAVLVVLRLPEAEAAKVSAVADQVRIVRVVR